MSRSLIIIEISDNHVTFCSEIFYEQFLKTSDKLTELSIKEQKNTNPKIFIILFPSSLNRKEAKMSIKNALDH